MTTKTPVPCTDPNLMIRPSFWKADFILIRFETEYTPCTGITAVDKQERRHFPRGLMIAPWCRNIKHPPGKNPSENGKVIDTGYSYLLSNGKLCRVLMTTDEFMPIFFLAIDGCFEGTESPYDVPPETLRIDTLVFGEACEKLIRLFGTQKQFIWGADWESVPALVRLHGSYVLALTLHNEFDECLAPEAQRYGNGYEALRAHSSAHAGEKTALEVGLEIVDVATAVNRGYAYGLTHETIHQLVMAAHINHLTGRIVGINNAAFSPLAADLRDLLRTLENDPQAGRDRLFALKSQATASLPADLQAKAKGKAVIVSMGRRVPQKQHDVLVEAARSILRKQPDFPLLLVFATVHGDDGSPARLNRMHALEKEFPENVICLGRIDFYAQLMLAADFNCLPSLWEPHGGAFDGTVVPIARAIDGLAEQIAPLDPSGEAARIASLWHSAHEQPTGFLFREPATTGTLLEAELRELLQQSPSPQNGVFRSMVEDLTAVLVKAVALRLEEPQRFAHLVKNVLEKQEGTSWQVNLGGILALVEQRRAARMLSEAA